MMKRCSVKYVLFCITGGNVIVKVRQAAKFAKLIIKTENHFEHT